jgi:hypothetical protein
MQFFFKKNCRCPKQQLVQSVKCSNVGKYTCSSRFREDAAVCSVSALEIVDRGGVIMVRCYLRSNIPQTALVATLDTYDLIII